MNSADDDFESLLERLAPMSESEQFETLLTYFNDVIRTMDTDSLRIMRAALLRMHPGAPEEIVVLEVIEGLLALRDLAT